MRIFLSIFVIILSWSCSNETSKGSGTSPTNVSIADTLYTDSLLLKKRTSDTSPNHLIFRRKFEVAEKAGVAFSDKVTAVALDFIGTPYTSGTLEKKGQERLVINLAEVDCWTFVEYCVAIAQTSIETDTADYSVFEQKLQRLRYREGVVDGYGSRIHYFAEWMLQQTTDGDFLDITPSLGGSPYKKKISFMSNHPSLYPRLKDTSVLEQIIKVEKKLNKYHLFYIPKANTLDITSMLLSGDILAITSRLPDLDFEHEGFAVLKNDIVYLLHASYDYKKVILSRSSFVDYARNKKNQTGFVFIRHKN